MFTTAQFSKSSQGLYEFVYQRWINGTSRAFLFGASWPGDTNSSNVGWGQWSWVDGTNSSNLNCYSKGCGLWGG